MDRNLDGKIDKSIDYDKEIDVLIYIFFSSNLSMIVFCA